MAIAVETLAEGDITTWAGTTGVGTSPAGVYDVRLPDWHGAPPSARAGTLEIVIRPGGDAAAERHLHQALDELAEFFGGARRAFTVALDGRGPDFFRRVWAEVARVPYGETRSYGEIARSLGAPKATRAVGAANGANPIAPFVPCHRIVGGDGRLTGYGPGLPLKQRLLIFEDAIPAGSADYAAWVARVAARMGGGPIYLGVREDNVYCRPECQRPQRRLRPGRVFHTAMAAEDAGFRACELCRPAGA